MGRAWHLQSRGPHLDVGANIRGGLLAQSAAALGCWFPIARVEKTGVVKVIAGQGHGRPTCGAGRAAFGWQARQGRKRVIQRRLGQLIAYGAR